MSQQADNRQPKIGFIGLGIMGLPMAKNLLNKGYEVTGYARRPKRCQSFVDAGGELLDSPLKVGLQADVLITIVSDTPDVAEVLFSDNGAAQSMRSGSLVIDMSTISPHETRQFSERLKLQGITMLDAPVSGGEIGAVEGILSIMVGGSESDLERARPLFECMGKTITHIGSTGAGQVAKACNQMLVVQIINGVAEALRFAEKSEVDVEAVRQALSGGMAACRALEFHAPKMMAGDYSAGFMSQLHLKDLNIVAKEMARLNLSLQGTELGLEKLQQMVALGEGGQDSRVIHKHTG